MGRRGAWRIGGYVADELIGYGASAQVWRGHVGRTSEPVALKVLDLADASAVRAAKAEAALLSALDHPHLMRLRQLVPDGESIVLVLELAGGGSLAQLLERRGRLSPGEVVAALSPVAAALAYTHDAGVVHSDVSPANVLFRSDGSPLLADLGVARLVGGFDAPRSTLAYIDPSVAAGAVPSEASDVFMVAATALHALTGFPPWSGDTAEAVLDHAVTGEIDGLDSRLDGLPAALTDVLRRGLDPSPVVRGSAAEFALDLRHAAPPVPVDLGVGPARPVRPGPGQPVGSVPMATDAASARAQLRSRLTSPARAHDDSAAGVYAPLPEPTEAAPAAHGWRRRAPKVPPTSGRSFARGAAAAEAAPALVHVPRHAAGSTRSASASTPSGPTAARTDVALERPDFARPDVPQPTAARPSAPRSTAPRSTPPRSASPRSTSPRSASPRSGPLSAVDITSNRPDPEADGPPLALTHIVRSRVRPVDLPDASRWHFGRPNRSTSALLAIVVVAVLAAGATAAWLRWEPSWARHRPAAAALEQPVPPGAGSRAGSKPSPGAATGASPSPTHPSFSASSGRPASSPTRPAGGGSGTPRPTTSYSRAGPTSSATAWPTTDAGWTAVLASLDLTRQHAFAVDDPVPLSGVYSDVALLRQDRATLRHVVTPGCRLLGLRTVYRRVHASSVTPHQVVLSTQASLAPARLICPHRPPRDLAAHVPVDMTIVLARVGGQFLIASIQVPT